MLINADFSVRAVVTPQGYKWVASPQAGVERVMLDRIGGEKARATSIVRYAPHSHFSPHGHPGGEEVLVLEGMFSEGDRHYPAGWYLRNPPGSAHQPSSENGALIFVKLRQMPDSETRHVRIDTRDPAHWVKQDGRAVCPLFHGENESVCVQRLSRGVSVLSGPVKGAELLVLEGGICEGAQQYPRGSWIRLPPGHHPAFVAGDDGASVYLKTGHLQDRIEAHTTPFE